MFGTGATLESRDLRIPSAAIHDFPRWTPRPSWIVQPSRVGDVNPLVVEILVSGAVQEHHVSLQILIPMDGRPPERVGRDMAVVPRFADR